MRLRVDDDWKSMVETAEVEMALQITMDESEVASLRKTKRQAVKHDGWQ